MGFSRSPKASHSKAGRSDFRKQRSKPDTLGIGNGGGKQGSGNHPTYRRYGPDTDFQYRPPRSYTELQNQAEFSPKGKPIRNFSIGSHIVDTDIAIADAIFADAISETPR